MKKRLFIFALITCMVGGLVGCNKQVLDFTYSYNYAYVLLPNGECVEGEVQSWTDYADGDQIQLRINGVTYLTDTTRTVLVKR